MSRRYRNGVDRTFTCETAIEWTNVGGGGGVNKDDDALGTRMGQGGLKNEVTENDTRTTGQCVCQKDAEDRM